MGNEVVDPKTNEVEEPCCHEDGRRRYVFFPMLRSSALAFFAVVLATVAAAGAVMLGLDPEVQTASVSNESEMATGTKGSREVVRLEGSGALGGESEDVAKMSSEAGAAENGKPAAVVESAGADPKPAAAVGAESVSPPAASSSASVSGDGEPEDGGRTSDPGHQHAWVAEMKTVDHAAVYQDIPHEAVYEKKKWTQCNACLGDITGNVAGHMAEHAAAGEPASYHTEESSVCVAEAWTEYGVLVKDAYSEKVPTGAEVCSCGARR